MILSNFSLSLPSIFSMDFCMETVMRNPGFLIEERSDSSLLRLILNFFLFIAAYKQYT